MKLGGNDSTSKLVDESTGDSGKEATEEAARQQRENADTIVDGIVDGHFASNGENVHDYSVRPEMIHNQNFDFKLNFYSVFAIKAVLRFRQVYGNHKEGHVFLSSSKLKVLQKSYLDHLDESALTARGLELLFEIKS